MEEALNWFETGVTLYEKTKYMDAIAAFDKAISINPSMAEAWNNRGLALFQTKRYQEALASFDKTLVFNPGHQNAKKAREITLEILGDQNTAKKNPGPAQQSHNSSDNHSATEKTRKPWLAALCSLLFPGWGQWYTGRTWEGLGFFGALVIIWIFDWVNEKFLGKNMLLCALFWIIFLGIWIYGAYDAYKSAKRINRGELDFVGKSRLFWIPAVIIGLALLIIILGVIAPSLFMVAGNFSQTKIATASIQRIDANSIKVTYLGGPGADKVRQMTAFVIDSAGNRSQENVGRLDQLEPLKVGSSVTVTSRSPGTDHLTVAVLTNDGSGQVIVYEVI